METFDDIQIEESVGFEFGEYLYDNLFEEEDYEESFFKSLNSNRDF